MQTENKKAMEELREEIARYDRDIERASKRKKAVDPEVYYLKAQTLVKLSELLVEGKAQYMQQALDCYNKAINLQPEDTLYLVNRSKLHVALGNTELAVKDMELVSKLPKSTGVEGMHIGNTMRDISKLNEIQDSIRNLEQAGTIGSELAKVLSEHAGITAGLVVQVGSHGEELSKQGNAILDHSNKIEYLLATIEQLKTQTLSQSEAIKELNIEKLEMRKELEKNTKAIKVHDQILDEHEQKIDELQELITGVESSLKKVDIPSISAVIAQYKLSEEEKQQLEKIGEDVYTLSFYNNLRQQLNAAYTAASVIATGMVRNNKEGNLGSVGSVLQKVGEYTPVAGTAIKLCGEIISKVDYGRQLEKMTLLAKLVVDSGEMLELSELMARKLALELNTLNVKINSKDIMEQITDKLNTQGMEVSTEAAVAVGLYKATVAMKKGIKNISDYKKTEKANNAKIVDYAERFVFGSDATPDNMKEFQGQSDATIVAKKIIARIFEGIEAGTINEKADSLLKYIEEIYRNVPTARMKVESFIMDDKKSDIDETSVEAKDDEITAFIMREILGLDSGEFLVRDRRDANFDGINEQKETDLGGNHAEHSGDFI